MIGRENYPDSSMLLSYDDDEYSHGYGQNKETFGSLTKSDKLQPYIFDHDFKSTNVTTAGEDDNKLGYNFFVFDIRYQKKKIQLPNQKKEIKFD